MALKDTINLINGMRKEQKIMYAKEAVKEIQETHPCKDRGLLPEGQR